MVKKIVELEIVKASSQIGESANSEFNKYFEIFYSIELIDKSNEINLN